MANKTIPAIQTNEGNVGIGTTNPLASFAVHSANRTFDGYGNINVFTTNVSTTGMGGSIALGGENAQGTTPYVFGKIQGGKESGGTWNGYLALGTTISSSAIVEAMRINSSGNVGIGTINPYARLHSAVTANGFNPSLTYNSTASVILENWGVQLAMGVDTVNSQTFYLQAN